MAVTFLSIQRNKPEKKLLRPNPAKVVLPMGDDASHRFYPSDKRRDLRYGQFLYARWILVWMASTFVTRGASSSYPLNCHQSYKKWQQSFPDGYPKKSEIKCLHGMPVMACFLSNGIFFADKG
jgi:hypothetical protein